jgi:acyl carrier protein
MSQQAEETNRSWSREEVESGLKEILVDSLDIDEERILPVSSLVHDLGAESIDFLDIGFRVQQTFGVELPNKPIQERVINWRNLSVLRELLEERYGSKISSEDVKHFLTMGVPGVLSWLKEQKGTVCGNGDAEALAGCLADRLVSDVQSIGFRPSLIDHDGVKNLFMENLSSPKIFEGMLRLFSFGALVDFISDRLDGNGK